MVSRITILSALVLFSFGAQAQKTSDTKHIQIALEKLRVGGDTSKYWTSASHIINASSTYREATNAKSVYDAIVGDRINLIAGTGISKTGTWPNITIASTGGIAEPATQILVGTGPSATSYSGFIFNSSINALKIGSSLRVWAGGNGIFPNIGIGDSTLQVVTTGPNVGIGERVFKKLKESRYNVGIGPGAAENLIGPGSAFPETTSNFMLAAGYNAANKIKYSFDFTALGYANMQNCDSCNFMTSAGYAGFGNGQFGVGSSLFGWGAGLNMDTVIYSGFYSYGAGKFLNRSEEDEVTGFEAMAGVDSVSGGIQIKVSRTYGNAGTGSKIFNKIRFGQRNAGVGWRTGPDLRNGRWNTLMGPNTGIGLKDGYYNTVLGGQIVLDSSAYGEIHIGNGQGTVKFKNAGALTTIYDALKLNSYGTGARTGTAAYTLSVTAAGNVIETPVVTGGTVAEPSYQIVYGTTSAVDSKNGFEFDPTTDIFYAPGRANVAGILQIGTAGSVSIVTDNNDRLIRQDGTYEYLYAPNNLPRLIIGGGGDPTTYIDNDAVRFRTTGGSTMGVMNTNGLTLNSTSVTAVLDVTGKGNTSSTWSAKIQNSAGSETVMVRDDAKVAFAHGNPSEVVDVNGRVRVRNLVATVPATKLIGANDDGVLDDLTIVGGSVSAGVFTITDQSTTNEIQRLDTFTLVGSILRASLLNDGVPYSSVDLSAFVTTGTADQIPFIASGGTGFSTEAGSGSNAFTWKSATNRLGIGTTAPGYNLQLEGNFMQQKASGVIGDFFITNANADQVQGTWDFYTNTASSPDFFGKFGFKFEGGSSGAARQFQVYVANGTTPKFVVDANGQFGIGTITPGRLLDVNGETRLRDLSAGVTPTLIVGADINGVLNQITLGSGFSLPSGVLTYTATTPTLQQVTTAGYLTTRQIRTDSMFVVRGTQSTFCGVQLINTTASTGVGWSLRSMNNGGLQLISSGLANALTTWKGSDLFHVGKARVGPAATTVSSSIFAATDSTAAVAYSVIENKSAGAGASAFFLAKAEATGSGDAGLIFNLKNSSDGYVALDRSDSSALVIGLSTASVGTNQRFKLYPLSGRIILGGGSPKPGAEVTVNSDLAAEHYLAHSSAAPTVSATNAGGTAPTVTAFGSDAAFNLVYISGTVPDASDEIEITFNTPLPAGYKPVISKSDAGNKLFDDITWIDYTSKSETGFKLKFHTAPAASTTFRMDIVLVGTEGL